MVSLRLARKEALSSRIEGGEQGRCMSGQAAEQEAAHVDGQFEAPQLGTQLQGTELAFVIEPVEMGNSPPVRGRERSGSCNPEVCAARCSR